jgi:hypothetical protein
VRGIQHPGQVPLAEALLLILAAVVRDRPVDQTGAAPLYCARNGRIAIDLPVLVIVEPVVVEYSASGVDLLFRCVRISVRGRVADLQGVGDCGVVAGAAGQVAGVRVLETYGVTVSELRARLDVELH